MTLFFVGCGTSTSEEETETDNGAAEAEEPAVAESEWISLFDGESLDGWKRYGADEIGSLWKVEDGMIVCQSTGGGEASGDGGSLITVEQFDNFEFELDWMVLEAGNSGVMYHVVESDEYSHAFSTGPEYQLLDDLGYPDELKPSQYTASNYDMHAASSDKPVKPAGEWNTSKIVYDNGKVEHWLNGVKVVEFEEGSEDWNERYESSKWKDYPGWCKYKKGSIALQDHGNYTAFKNLRIKKL
jgi:hypothetical protein